MSNIDIRDAIGLIRMDLMTARSDSSYTMFNVEAVRQLVSEYESLVLHMDREWGQSDV